MSMTMKDLRDALGPEVGMSEDEPVVLQTIDGACYRVRSISYERVLVFGGRAEIALVLTAEQPS